MQATPDDGNAAVELNTNLDAPGAEDAAITPAAEVEGAAGNEALKNPPPAERPVSRKTEKDTREEDSRRGEIPRANVASTPFDSFSRPSGHRRSRSQRSCSNFRRAPEQGRAIGLGTVGLFENVPKKQEMPKDTSVYIKNTLSGTPAGQIRRLREYMEWREKHGELFLTMREQSEKERLSARQRRLREQERRREEDAHVYALAVKRMRRRGWPLLEKTPSRGENARSMKERAELEAFIAECEETSLRRYLQKRDDHAAFLAECEETALRKMRESSKDRNVILQQLAQKKEQLERQKDRVRDAARMERETLSNRREERSAQLKELAALLRAERDVSREQINECLSLEDRKSVV